MLKLIRPVIILSLFVLLTSCKNNYQTANGYIEGKFTYISSQTTGTLEEIAVKRGDLVKKDQPIFKLEFNPQLADFNQSKANLQEALSKLANLEKGKRPTEIAAIEAQRQQTIAKIDYAEKAVNRYKILAQKGFLQKETLDQAISNLNDLKSKLDEFTENLKTAKLKARSDEIAAAKANVLATEAALQRAQWQLTQKTIFSTIEGTVYDVYFRIGEVVPANNPVLSLLAPENIYAIFFVPEPQLSKMKVGQPIEITCDGCSKRVLANVSFISPEAEFTPPVIYSEKTRSKLIYKIEAKPSIIDATQLHPGQPITVKYKNL